MYRRLLSLWAAVVLLLVGILPANASAYGRVQVTDNTEAAYCGSTGVFTTATSATDIFNFKGSPTKAVYIRKILWKRASVSVAGTHNIYLIKRSTANSGGTSVALTAVPLDSGFASATASGVHYTANPTVGTSLGVLRHIWNYITSAFHSADQMTLFDSTKGGSPIVLRGTSESVSVNYNGVTDPIGAGACIDIEWSEK